MKGRMENRRSHKLRMKTTESPTTILSRKIHNLHSKVQETARLAYGSTVAIVQRGENLQEVGEKAEDFEEKAEHQAETAKSVKRRMYCFNCSPCCWWCC
mmetsp:Transcript_14679/g.27861  ORF Transcript_14679/g.27861 Transcript_14679/m.27861 type:complete len:99 (+) Transcript_14679:395-691(+)